MTPIERGAQPLLSLGAGQLTPPGIPAARSPRPSTRSLRRPRPAPPALLRCWPGRAARHRHSATYAPARRTVPPTARKCPATVDVHVTSETPWSAPRSIGRDERLENRLGNECRKVDERGWSVPFGGTARANRAVPGLPPPISVTSGASPGRELASARSCSPTDETGDRRGQLLMTRSRDGCHSRSRQLSGGDRVSATSTALQSSTRGRAGLAPPAAPSGGTGARDRRVDLPRTPGDASAISRARVLVPRTGYGLTSAS
jgi:hypothetical protein